MDRELTRRASGRDAVLTGTVIAATGALIYSNAFTASFHFDDFPSIVHNDALRDLSGFWPPSGRRWLGYLSFAIDYRLWGLDVRGFHLTNVTVHLVTALLVGRLAALALETPALRDAETGPLVRRWLPLAAGLLFAVHPLATQAVTYVVQRFTSLATLLYVGAVVAYLRARLTAMAGGQVGRAAVPYAGAVVLAAGAMKTKEIAVTLPFVVGVLELLLFRGSLRRFLAIAPLGAVALLVPLGVARETAPLADILGDAGRLAAETRDISRWTYFLTQTRVVAGYLRLLVLPVGQNLDPDVALSTSPLEPAVLGSLALLLGILAGAAVLLVRARRENRAPGVLVFLGVAWFFTTLSVESSIIPIRDVMVEHRVYLPLAGAAIVAAVALLAAAERVAPAVPLGLRVGAALLVVAGPLGAATYARNRVWRDELTLWSDVVAKSPRKARPRTNLGTALDERGRLDDAMREYREALRLDPSSADAFVDLGAAHFRKGEVGEAIRLYQEAIRLAPSMAEAHTNLGVALASHGDLEGAARAHREAIRLAPGLVDAHANLGAVCFHLGRFEEAERAYREAVRLDPLRAQLRSRLGRLLARRGLLAEAIAEFERGIRLEVTPDLAFNLAAALDDSGRGHEAISWYERYLAGRPADPDRAARARARLASLRGSGAASPRVR